jgi:PKD repeat protein
VLSALPTSGPAPLLVQLSSAGSNDPDGSITARTWDLGNGQTATGSTTQFNYTVPGTYTVALTITDNRGAKTTATETIVVDPPAAPKDRVRLQLSGDVNYTYDGRVDSGNLIVTRDAFGIAGVNGQATYTGPGNPNATVSVELSRFFIFNAFIGTVTVNDPINGVTNATGNVFFGALSSPSATSARGTAAGALQNPTRNFNMAFTIDDRAA